MEMNIRTVKTMNNGVDIPTLGLGVFLAPDGRQTADAVRWALEAGYRHIDTAAIYRNEASVGLGMRESGVPREEIFLTTKLWNNDMRAGRQREAFEESLKKLGTDYVDLYLIHWPVAGKYNESWQVMESLYSEGRMRAIGVSNFHVHHMEDLLAQAKVVPAVNQVECHPLLSQKPLMHYCEKLGIVFEAWSPIGGGDAGNLAGNAELAAIGAKYGKSAVQAILRWHLQRGEVVIPKSIHKERIIENADLYDFELDASDMAAVDAMNRDQRVGASPDSFTF